MAFTLVPGPMNLFADLRVSLEKVGDELYFALPQRCVRFLRMRILPSERRFFLSRAPRLLSATEEGLCRELFAFIRFLPFPPSVFRKVFFSIRLFRGLLPSPGVPI